MEKVKIIPTRNSNDSAEALIGETKSHIKNVSELMDVFSRVLSARGSHHDFSKITKPYSDYFIRDFLNYSLKDKPFKDSPWYKSHSSVWERHHLNAHIPEDVDLIDVIEMICDCICAGYARSGDVYKLSLPEGVLEQAFQNTVEKLKGWCDLRDVRNLTENN